MLVNYKKKWIILSGALNCPMEFSCPFLAESWMDSLWSSAQWTQTQLLDKAYRLSLVVPENANPLLLLNGLYEICYMLCTTVKIDCV